MSGSIEITLGTSKQLDIKAFNINNEEIQVDGVEWSVSDSAFLSVNNGFVTTKKSGSAEVIVTLGSVEARASISIPNPVQPNEVDGLILWLDHTDDSTLFDQDGFGTFLAAGVGDSVAKWEDKSGQLNHFEQSNIPDRPTRTATGVDFSVSDAVELTGDLTLSGSATIMVYFTCNNPSNAGIYTISDNVEWIDGAADRLSGRVKSSQYFVEAANNNNGGQYNSGDRVVMTTDYSWNSGDVEVHVDGNSVISGSIGVATDGSGVANGEITQMRIGDDYGRGDQDSADVLDGEISGVLVYNRTLTDEERNNLEVYLSTLV